MYIPKDTGNGTYGEKLYIARTEAIENLLNKTAKKFIDIFYILGEEHQLMTCDMESKIDVEMIEAYGKILATKIIKEIQK